MRAIYKKISGQKIVVGSCQDDQVADDNSVFTSNFTLDRFPEATPEIRAYIDAHSMVSLNLYKVNEQANAVELRTPAEMDAIPGASWAHKVKAGA